VGTEGIAGRSNIENSDKAGRKAKHEDNVDHDPSHDVAKEHLYEHHDEHTDRFLSAQEKELNGGGILFIELDGLQRIPCRSRQR